MRLTQIKLAGFKSFVDPTHFQVPGQLVGVVGPNGCGKSNIIDAARWVLGESKASELRGESMQDVIFNGSSQRKPAGRASVELVFDNAAGRAAGQWSQYAEIAVKRVLTRDGTSTYYINNQVVRRRDIQDIFLGTGLGPRAYAIIGQGMITRIIEARPEELRVFLEEAAGVSKYKERRRETENRLSDTRENLTRVEDILRELNANLDKLEAQAVVAQQYRELQASFDEKQKLVWVLRRNEARAEQERQSGAIERAGTELEARTADLRHVEAALETLRAAHYAAGDAVHAAQGRLYEANSSVNSLEAEIRFVIESRNRLQSRMAALAAQREQWSSQGSRHRDELAASEAALEAAVVACERAEAVLHDHAATLPQREDEARQAQARVSEIRAQVMQVEQALQLESAHQRNADRNLQNLQARRERLAQERGGLQRPDETRMAALQVEVADSSERLAALQSELHEVEARLPELQSRRSSAHEAANRENVTASQLEARLAALRQLQERVQGQGKLQPWLDKHELARLPRLWQRLHIEPGWETALEAVLRERIAALEVSQLDWARAFFGDAPPARLSLFSAANAAASAAPGAPAGPAPAGFTSLVSLLQINDPNLRALLTGWIGQVYTADSAEQALARRNELPPGAQFVVRAGHVIERNAVRFHASDSEQDGMLARQQEMENLTRQLRAQQLLSEETRTAAVQADAAANAANARLGELRQASTGLTQALHARQLELQRLTQQFEAVASRSDQIEAELGDLIAQIEHESALKFESEAKFEELDVQLADVQARHEDEQVVAEEARHALDAARDTQRRFERELQEAGFNERNVRSRIAELERSIEVAVSQDARLAEEHGGVQLEFDTLSDANAQSGLQEALDARLARETELANARTELDALTAQLREADENRLRIERELEPLRGRIGALQLSEQAARLAQEQYVNQLAEAQADLAALDALVASEEGARLRPNALQSELARIQQQIAALGAVNLAALDELTVARERKTFLDAQMADLTSAIDTLEDAIRKIDRETRDLLQTTFDQVNQHFGELFPILFGGGEAKLVMTGDEILDAGVQVMAQPPGKKNSTIHLLSGGEKALTATALVFALFQLNPAPFCLLDEVDAPLDDANTERFCNLVRKMSANTQFLFISHNKIAMEMAQQLIGVTMQEQGVSRIVAVDMDAAVRFAAAPPERVAA